MGLADDLKGGLKASKTIKNFLFFKILKEKKEKKYLSIYTRLLFCPWLLLCKSATSQHVILMTSFVTVVPI